ncbi:phosphoheptose isomerase [Bacillus phage Zuko]|uniref:phosphoheptose isomerase n=1 Tax=Bacillus phage Zuko TaxID=1805956 RepID=UPI0007A77559|nr:phosphoheptose isomerase [Bacillus phage Zuko]AMW62409.1 phosphatase [Bacillus phage Zuko]
MDYFMIEENAVNRLVREWNTYGQIVVAYDFDNTVYDYHQEGHDYSEVIELIHQLHEAGAYLMVYTARPETELDKVKNYLFNHRIPFHSVNKMPDFLPFTENKKLYYNILLDDRAGLESAVNILRKVLTERKLSGNM